MMRWRAILIFLAACLVGGFGLEPQVGALPEHILVGYWHNWAGWPATLRLSEVPAAFDVINVAFATPTSAYGATMSFVPDPNIYPDPEDFSTDIELLQNQGRTVLISMGGANNPVVIDEPEDVETFVSSMAAIITTYGFDGLDIDVEGGSLNVDSGDHDFRQPTSPKIVYFIEAIDQLLEELPDLVLTAAPETAHVQGGYTVYGGVWGAYLPLLHHFRDSWTYVHVQHYNTGSMYGRDGVLYEPVTADFHVAMADMLLAGFSVDVWGANIYFNPLRADQVAIGLPAGQQAGGNYTPVEIVHEALDYLVLGIPFGGQYLLSEPAGYQELRGLMTWSINWDTYYECAFSNAHRAYLDNLPSSSSGAEEDSPFNSGLISLQGDPFNPVYGAGAIHYTLSSPAEVVLSVFDPQGRRVAVFVDTNRNSGPHTLRFDLRLLPPGVYGYHLGAGAQCVTGKLCLVG